MDLLGLFTGIFARCWSFHRDTCELWLEKCDGGSIARIGGFAGDCVLLLSASVLRMHGKSVSEDQIR